MRRVCVFCGSCSGADESYARLTRELAEELIERDLGVVYGGGSVGLMGVLADRVLDLGGHITGVIPRKLEQRELAHEKLSELIVVDSMHARKARMAALSDAFIALPGGMGTIEEITEMFTLLQIGYFQKPCILINGMHYFDSFVRFMDEMVAKGFLSARQRQLMQVVETPREAVLRCLPG